MNTSKLPFRAAACVRTAGPASSGTAARVPAYTRRTLQAMDYWEQAFACKWLERPIYKAHSAGDGLMWGHASSGVMGGRLGGARSFTDAGQSPR
jgi:hypothetical protein